MLGINESKTHKRASWWRIPIKKAAITLPLQPSNNLNSTWNYKWWTSGTLKGVKESKGCSNEFFLSLSCIHSRALPPNEIWKLGVPNWISFIIWRTASSFTYRGNLVYYPSSGQLLLLQKKDQCHFRRKRQAANKSVNNFVS